MFRVKEGCPGCGACLGACPVGAIAQGDKLAVVISGDCIDCGVCAGACPIGLIEKAPPEAEEKARKGGSKKAPPIVEEEVKGGSTDAEADSGV